MKKTILLIQKKYQFNNSAMNKRYLLFCFVFLGQLVNGQDTWLQRDSVGGPPKSAAAAFSVNGRGFAVGGIDQFEFKRKCYKYNPTTDNWSTVTSLGGDLGSGLERASAVAFATSSMGFVGLGSGSNPFFKDFWRYDPVYDTWTQVADFAGTGRTQAVAFCVQEKGYVGTGQDATGYKKDFYMYDPLLNTWTPVADFGGTARRQAVGFNIGDCGYVGTGDDGTFKKDFWQYNPTTDTWIQKADFGGTPRYGASGFSLFPSGFIGTGYDNTLNYTADFWEYNYWNDTWTKRADLPGLPRANAIGFSLAGVGYMGSGYDGAYRDDFYLYTAVIGVNEFTNENLNVALYPNPVVDFMNVRVEPNSVSQIDIYDMSGKKLITQNFSQVHALNNGLQIECSHLNNGMYVCLFTNEDKVVATRKFMVSK